MKRARVRVLPLLLAAVMLASLLAPAAAAAEDAPAVTGSISATVRIDYVQALAELARRNVRVELKRDGTSVTGGIDLTSERTDSVGACTVQVSLRNGEGAPLDGGKWPGYLDVTIDGLPRGSYTLTFTGRGYRTYTTDPIEVKDYARQVIVGTGDATFTLGDVTGDNAVTEADRAAVSGALGTSGREEIQRFDLNGDGKVDIIDLSYVNRQLKAQGGAEYRETALLGNPVQLPETEAALTAAKTTVERGSLNSLFAGEGSSATFVSTDDSQIVIPLVLADPVEVSEVEIVTPVGGGEVQKGTVSVLTEGGERIEVPFDHTLPAGVHAIGRAAESSVVTIDLGKRVAVKKVTITVVKTGDAYATVETVRFLKDIVPENPTPPNSTIKGLAAQEGHEQVSLTWQVLPNVSGYTVHSWPRSDSTKVKELRTTVNSAAVTGLENLVEYAFTVTPTDGSWTGKTSQPVYATPQPAKVPAAPDMVNVGVLDGALTVSWKKSENATFYEVFYQEKGAADWKQAGGQLTATGLTLNGLTNDVTYSIYIIAGNSLGRSGRSRVAEGTPRGVVNERPAGIPSAGILGYDKIQSMELADKGNYDRNSYTAERPWGSKNMWDDDYTTHWTAAGWTRNEHVVTTFTEPVDLTAAFWVPRLDGGYPSYLRAYSVRVWYEGEDLGGAGHLLTPDPEKGGQDNGGTGQDVHTWHNVANYSTCAADKFAVLPFGPVENVRKISVAVEQRDYLTVSLSELLFMEYDPAHSLPADIDALFVGGGDGLHTELASGVEQGTIDALRARLNSDEGKYYLNTAMLADELVLAEELLRGEGARVLLTGIESRSAAADSAKYQQGGSVLQPLGAAAGMSGDKFGEITVYAAGIPAGQSVTLYASQYNAEANAWLAEAGKIQNGRNVFTIPKIGSQNTPRGGSLYVTYGGTNPEEISLHVRRAADIPLLDLSGWYAMTEAQRTAAIRAYAEELTAYAPAVNAAAPTTDWRNVTEIATPTVLLSLPASAALSGLGNADLDGKTAQLTNSVLAWEDLMHVCRTTQGIDNTYQDNDMQTRQNIRCMQMFTGAFMYAAGSHIGIGYGSCSGMVGGTPIRDLPAGASANGLFGWGIAHEIGHNMDKLGKAEITNNIYAIMVQTCDGDQNTLPSRLEKSGKYASIFTKTAQATPGASGDVFTQLGMYWQLHLAYDSGERPMDFYNRFFKAWKARTYISGSENLSYDEQVALTAAGVAGKDLTEFFTRWGMALSAGVRNQISSYNSEDRAVWYLSDQSRRDRLAGNGTLSGSFTASAALTEGRNNEVTLTIDGSGLTGDLQGYEILRNGQSIGFVIPQAGGKSGTYTDLIGSANHRVFDYAVVAYSTLGTALAEAEAGSVRIAYDAVLDPDSYDSEWADGVVTITLKAETAVSGLKLTGGTLTAENAYTVAITDGAGKETAAKDSAFDPALNEARDDRDCYLLYFNKPGTGAEDSRIWTYDAKTIVITGMPQGVTVQPISYAGDDVAFMANGAVGRLAADYDLGGGEKIAAGTVVIAGTYRGDPLYNYVAVQGRFATAPDENGENEVVERALSGDCYLFAEVPGDGEVSDISNGIFIFVPNLKAEETLQGVIGNCGAESLLPGQMKLEFYRTDVPNDTSSKRRTAETMWLTTPGGDALPAILLEGRS